MSQASDGEPLLVVILGPTASGKSHLGIEIARLLEGEVVVCDSTQVYRHFDIGTAKVRACDQRGIPHHLVDLVEPDEVFTAGDYRRRAVEVLDDLKQRGKTPVLTAGTGLYLKALLEGLSEAPERSEELRVRLRKAAERRGREHLHKILYRIDPAAAGKIASADTQKVIRAIEIRFLARKAVGDVHRAGREGLSGFSIMKIGLNPDRKALYARIEQRTREMIASGWIDEVGGLIAAGISPDAKPFQFIGYAGIRRHLAGEVDECETIARIQKATRQFAKRQMTWFRREAEVHWLPGFGDDPNIIAEASHLVRLRPE